MLSLNDPEFEDQILRPFISGDESVQRPFLQACQRFARTLLRARLNRVRNSHLFDVSAAESEMATRMLQNREHLPADLPGFRAFLTTSTKNFLIDFQRRRANHIAKASLDASAAEAGSEPSASLADALPGRDPGPSAEMRAAELGDRYRDWLIRLSPENRQLWFWHVDEKRTHREIGAMLQKSEYWVRRRLKELERDMRRQVGLGQNEK